MNTARLSIAAIVIALVALGTSCSSGGDATSPSLPTAPSQNESTEPQPETAAANDGPSTDPTVEALPVPDVERELSPLETLFGTFIDPESQHAETNRVLALRAEAVTQCMADQGFGFYVEPAEQRALDRFVPPLQAGSFDLDRMYGAAANLDQMLDRAQSGLGLTENSVRHDLNRQGYEALSEEAQAEFSETFGPCLADASTAHPDPGSQDSIPDEVQGEIRRVQEDMAASPRFDEVWAEWSACMQALGYSFTNREEAGESLTTLTEEARRSVMDDRNVDSPSIGADSLRLVEAVREAEVALATDDWSCAQDVRLAERLRTIQYELEADAVRENGDRWTLMLNADS